jgi:archaellum component FlaC
MARYAAMGGTGFGGAYLYNHQDLLDYAFSDGFKGILHYFTAPSTSIGDRSSPAVATAQMSALESLSRELSDLKHAQRHGYNSLITASQPATILGVPMWQIIGLATTMGSVYWKVKGYELKDLVYVSKAHFTNVTDSLKAQFSVLQDTLEVVKADLMERVHNVHLKLVEVQESIEMKIGLEIGKVDEKIGSVSSELVKVNDQLSQSNSRMDGITEHITSIGKSVSTIGEEIDDKLGKVHSEVEELREASDENYKRMACTTSVIDQKLEKLSSQTTHHLTSLQSGLDDSSRGIKLLCEYVCSQSQTTNNPELIDSLQKFAKSSPVTTFASAPFALAPFLRHGRNSSSSGTLKFSLQQQAQQDTQS